MNIRLFCVFFLGLVLSGCAIMPPCYTLPQKFQGQVICDNNQREKGEVRIQFLNTANFDIFTDGAGRFSIQGIRSFYKPLSSVRIKFSKEDYRTRVIELSPSHAEFIQVELRKK
jgi:hypothetical protein